MEQVEEQKSRPALRIEGTKRNLDMVSFQLGNPANYTCECEVSKSIPRGQVMELAVHIKNQYNLALVSFEETDPHANFILLYGKGSQIARLEL